MRVALDVRTAIGAFPGAKYHCTRLAHWLPKVSPRHDYTGVLLRSLRHPPDPEDVKFLGLPVIQSWLPSSVANFFWNRDLEWTPEWFSRPFDIYCQTDCGLPPLMKGPKYAAFIHDLTFVRHPEFFEYPKRFVDLLKVVIKRADVILVVSETTRTDLLNYDKSLSPDRVEVILNAADVTPKAPAEFVKEVRRQHGLSNDYFVAVGEIHRKKNLAALAKAYFSLLEACPEAPDLVLVGRPGNGCDDLERVLAASPQRQRVKMLGYLAENQVYAILQGALALLYPSLWEGFGLPPLQAMALEVPVLASNTGSIPEIVADAGVLVSPTSHEQMLEGMRLLTTSDSTRRDFIAKGLERVQDFSWEKSCRKLAEVFERL